MNRNISPMKPKVWLAFNWPDDVVARLEEVAEVIFNDPEHLSGADVVVVRYADGPFMDRVGPGLKLIARSGIGVDGIDIQAAAERGILITNTPDAPTESTAEHAVALLLAVAKRVMVGDMQLRGADLPRSAMIGTEVKGRTLGVVGYGRIGRRVAEICALGLRMKVLVYDPFCTETVPAPEGVTFISELDILLAQADFVTLHTPLTPETRHLIDAAALRRMKPTAILVNMARGPVVDTDALVQALQEGWIQAAALDVTDPEPLPADHILYTLENCLIAPHIGSATQHTRRRMAELACENLLAGLNGRRLPHCANPQVYESL